MRTFFQVVLLIFLFSPSLRTQCSDAGVCTLGHRPLQRQATVALDYAFGRSSRADDLTFHSFSLSGHLPLFESSVLTVILPFNRQSGPLGSVSGLSDPSIIVTQEVMASEGTTLSLSLGLKPALADVNAGNLPQSYQSGLGTTDILAGVSLASGRWNASLGYQLSRGRSDNFSTRLKRGDDLLISAGYTVAFGDLDAGAEVLAIKRLHESNVLATLMSNPPSTVDIPGSDQSQINVVLKGSLPVSESLRVRGMIAIPTLKREINVDGLTRSLSLSVGLLHSF